MPQSLLILGFTETTTLDAFGQLTETAPRPHRAYDPMEDQGVQFHGWNHASKSLRVPEGPARAQAYQLAIVGSRSDVGDYSPVWWERLAGEIRTIAAETNTPLRFPWSFDLPAQMTPEVWAEAGGVCGRMHEPEAIHKSGDFSKLVAILNGPTSATSIEPEPIPIAQVDEWQNALREFGHGISDPAGVFGGTTFLASVAALIELRTVTSDLEQAQQRIAELEAVDSFEERNAEALDSLRAFRDALRAVDG